LDFDFDSLSPEVKMGLADRQFSTPTAIQRDAIPVILQGLDVLASAQTGTGKTAAFAIPILEKLMIDPKPGVRALILAPTRELAQQIDEQLWTIGYHSGITTACVYGGGDWGAQQNAVKEGVNIIVATPGRLIDLIRVLNIDFSALQFLVLDEADRMLDMGFIPDVRLIVSKLPKDRQTLMFSATISDRVDALVRELTRDPVRINVSTFTTAKGVTQQAYKVREDAKIDLVLEIFETADWQSGIIFCSTKRGTAALARVLAKKGVKVGSMHGDMEQHEREATLAEFRNNRISTIVATDVMARGIDVTNVTHVMNFNVPRDLDDYIHRIGRTARAEKTGTAITLVSPEDERHFRVILHHVGKNMEFPKGIITEGDSEPQPEARSDRRPPRGESRKPDGRGPKPQRSDAPRPEPRKSDAPRPESRGPKPQRSDAPRPESRKPDQRGPKPQRSNDPQMDRIRKVMAGAKPLEKPAPEPAKGLLSKVFSIFKKK
jgi:ATP-dependent RNA helicase RhlE